MEYVFKGIAMAMGQAFCFNVLLPIWYAIIKISDFLKGNK